jgi:N utilization substance protein B
VADGKNLEKIIASKSKNWDVERIAAVDFIILKLALSELIKFPGIPIKVTINEYIEICKAYSTPKSKQYVNGILDVLSNELMRDGTVKKSGRGLLDNK